MASCQLSKLSQSALLAGDHRESYSARYYYSELMSSSHCCCSYCKPSQPYSRKVLQLQTRPDLKRTVESVYDFLLETVCRFPRDEEERDIADKNKTILPTEFPYQWNLLKLESYERPITDSFQGPIYWNDFHREVFAGLKPFKIHSGGQGGALTVRGLCEAILETGYRPEEEQNIIGNVHVQMRVEDDTEALTIIFVC